MKYVCSREERLGRETINCFSPPPQTSPISTPLPAIPPRSYSSAFLWLWQSVKADTVCRRSVEGFWLPRRWVAEGGGCARGQRDCPGLWLPSWIMFIREQIQAPPWDQTVWGTEMLVKAKSLSPEHLGSTVSWFNATFWWFLQVPIAQKTDILNHSTGLITLYLDSCACLSLSSLSQSLEKNRYAKEQIYLILR